MDHKSGDADCVPSSPGTMLKPSLFSLHCFPSCLACSEHGTFWGTVASVPLEQGSAQQGSDPSWTPPMLPTWEPHRGNRPAALTQHHPVLTLRWLYRLLFSWQHPRPALLHAHVPAASPACLTPSVPLLHPDHLNNLPTTWNN